MRSSTDVLSRNSLTPSGCRSKTSSARKSRTWRLEPEKDSTKPEVSWRSRIERAASCRAAIHPSVTPSSTATSPSESESHHIVQEGARLLGRETQVGGAHFGHLVPDPEPGEGEGGSARLEMTRRAFSGRCSKRKETASWTGSESIRW